MKPQQGAVIMQLFVTMIITVSRAALIDLLVRCYISISYNSTVLLRFYVKFHIKMQKPWLPRRKTEPIEMNLSHVTSIRVIRSSLEKLLFFRFQYNLNKNIREKESEIHSQTERTDCWQEDKYKSIQFKTEDARLFISDPVPINDAAYNRDVSRTAREWIRTCCVVCVSHYFLFLSATHRRWSTSSFPESC